MQDEDAESKEKLRQLVCCVVWQLGVLDIHQNSEENREEKGGLPMKRREWKRDVPNPPSEGGKDNSNHIGVVWYEMKDGEAFLRETAGSEGRCWDNRMVVWCEERLERCSGEKPTPLRRK